MHPLRADQPPAVGESPAFLRMLEQVSRVAPLSKPVLVMGERGTGKELVAWRLHYLSKRWSAPLVKLNCSVLTEGTLESELFGHEAGAFTGATRRHIGRFERAHRGTLFLDEIGTISMRMQEKILRVVEYGEFERVGASETLRVDVRTVGATNADLPALVRSGKFRADLLDRLAFDVIHIPQLRERREDILLLAQHFAVNMVRELGGAYFPGFSPAAQQALLQHPWPGNVRALKHAVERSVYRSNDRHALIEHIELDPFAKAPDSTAPELPDETQPAETDPAPAAAAKPPDAHTPAADTLPIDLKREVSALEQALIHKAMLSSRHQHAHAAELLGLTYHQLRGYLRKHGLVERYGRNRR